MPYGAELVPQALRETRLTLRDIVSDLLSSKVQESKLKLAVGQMGVEREGMALEAEKLRQVGLADVAEAAFKTRRAEKEIGLREAINTETGRHNIAMEKVAETGAEASLKRAATEEEKQALIKQQWDYMNTPVPNEKIISEYGLMPTQGGIVAKKYPKGLTRTQAEKEVNNLMKNPALFHMFALLGDIDQRDQLAEQLQNPNISPDERDLVEKQYDHLLRKIGQKKNLVQWFYGDQQTFTAKELKERKEELRYAWDSELPQQVKDKYRNYQAFEKSMIEEDIKQLIAAGSANLDKLIGPLQKDKPGEEKAPVLKPADEKEFMDKLNRLEKMDRNVTNVEMIQNKVRELIKAGKTEEARKLLDGAMSVEEPEIGAADKKTEKSGKGETKNMTVGELLSRVPQDVGTEKAEKLVARMTEEYSDTDLVDKDTIKFLKRAAKEAGIGLNFIDDWLKGLWSSLGGATEKTIGTILDLPVPGTKAKKK